MFAIDSPSPLISPVAETPLRRLGALHERMHALKAGEARAAVYQRDLRAFIRDWVWTQDEERGGQVARMPDAPYIDEVCDFIIEVDLGMIEKARRVMGSWILSAAGIWIAAGGQDPRWPSLMLSTHNRQVIVAAKKLKELQGSAWFLRERYKFIYDQAVERGIREVWPEFPTATWTFTESRWSNGCRINAVPSGPDAMRGPGATYIHADEVSFWPAARLALSSAKHVTQNGGHLIGITTACAGTHAHDIRDGCLEKGRR